MNLPPPFTEAKRIEFSCRLDRSDYVEFSLFRLNRPKVKIQGWKRFARNFVIWCLVGLALLALMRDDGDRSVPRSAGLYVLLGVSLICVFYLAFQKYFQRRSIQRAIGSEPDAIFEGQMDLVLDDQGVDCRSDGTHSSMEWRTFRRVEETPTHLFLMLSELQALVIPKRDLSPELASEIVRFSTERMAASRG